jgi:hypothetical protein
MAIIDAILKPALDSVTKLIGEFHLSPEDKAKAEQAIADASARAQQAAADYDVKLNDIAGQNIRADAASGDKFTARARPSFVYLIIAVLAFNYIGLPLAAIFGSHVQPIVLPADLLALFGLCQTGYSFLRSSDKALALPGDTSVNVLGLFKASNKS